MTPRVVSPPNKTRLRLAHRVTAVVAAATLVWVTGCGSDSTTDPADSAGGSGGVGGSGSCPAGAIELRDECVDVPATRRSNDFDAVQLESGEEVPSLCQSWRLDNDEPLWVNAVEMKNGGGYHHSNWLFVPEDMYDGPDGAWNCDEREYSEIAAAVAGGVVYAQGTQSLHDLQQFPEGVALLIPPRSKIIGGTHLLNTTPSDLSTEMSLALYTIDEGDVQVPLSPVRMNYGALTIPPMAKSEFTADCDFTGPAKGPLTGDLYYVMPHYHYLGTHFRLELLGGDNPGQLLFEDDGENTGKTLDPPLSLDGATGLRFTCGYDNPRAEPVGFGIGDQEMCVMLGFSSSPYIFDAGVNSGEAIEPQGGMQRYEGSCFVIGIQN